VSTYAVLWVALLVACLAAYALKLAGLAVPQRVLAHPVAQQVAGLIPVALLAALVAVQVLGDGSRLVLDARLAALAAAAVLLAVRAPFLVVVAGAAVVAAVLRALGWMA